MLHREQVKGKAILLSTTFLSLLAWIIPRAINFGWGIKAVLGYGYLVSLEKGISTLNLASKAIWFFLYLDYIILSLGIILFIFAAILIYKYKSLAKGEKLIIEIALSATFFLVKLLPRLSQSQQAVGLYASGIKSIILN